MTHITCRLTVNNQDQLRNPTLGNRVWATFTFNCYSTNSIKPVYPQAMIVYRSINCCNRSSALPMLIAWLLVMVWFEESLTPHPTQYRSFRRRSSQPITWLILTNKTVQENTNSIQIRNSKQPKIQQKNKTTLVQLPLQTLGQETRWAYSTMPEPTPGDKRQKRTIKCNIHYHTAVARFLTTTLWPYCALYLNQGL